MFNIDELILKSDSLKNKFDEDIYNFVVQAKELVKLTKGEYQVEVSTILNKISLKDYILESDICHNMKENNINGYSIEELKGYLNKYASEGYEIKTLEKAISLYEQVERLEIEEKEIIDTKINDISKIIPNILDIKSIIQDKYEELYYNLITMINNRYNPNSKEHNFFINTINEIFNYYINGYHIIEQDYIDSI